MNSKGEQKVITVDGPAASGKTSMSRELAKNLGWDWVSTGAFYRGLGFVVQKKGADLNDEATVVDICLNADWHIEMSDERTRCLFEGRDVTEEIYQEAVGTVASAISTFPRVRAALLQAQRDCLSNSNGLVAEGRDCGTVVFPQAQLKVYLTARSESRAERRVQEQGGDVDAVLAAQKMRDQQDSSRKTAPLEIPEGAFVVDTSQLTLLEVVSKVENKVRKSFLSKI